MNLKTFLKDSQNMTRQVFSGDVKPNVRCIKTDKGTTYVLDLSACSDSDLYPALLVMDKSQMLALADLLFESATPCETKENKLDQALFPILPPQNIEEAITHVV